MIRFLLRRALAALLILWAVGTVTFVVTTQLGDPVSVIAGPRASAADRAHVRAFYGLNDPTIVQYGRFMGRLARGDLGRSYRYRRPVSELIAERFPRTALLASLALVFEVTLGVFLGLVAAARKGKPVDTAVMASSFVMMSTPTFLSGKFLLVGLAYYAGLFPLGGYGTTALEHVYHAILPAFALAALAMAHYARLVRNELVEVLRSDFVRTARAKGLSEGAVLVKHALRNALLPVVTSVGLSIGALLGGAIVTETIFAWPGLGRLAYEAIVGLDVPTILGTVLFGSLLVQLGTLLSDLAYAYLDPRIRGE